MNTKLTNSLLTLLGIAGLTFGAFNLIRLNNLILKNKKKEEEAKSNFSGGDKNLKTITFKLTNNTNNTQVEYLFDSVRGKDNPEVNVSSNLEFFNIELTNVPKVVKKIEFRGKNNFSGIDAEPEIIENTVDLAAPVLERGELTTEEPAGDTAIAPSTTVEPSVETVEEPIVEEYSQYNQAEAPFKIVCRDASGNANIQQFSPRESAYQAQSNITLIKFKNLVLDGICLMKYTMYPKSAVNIIVYYEDLNPSKLLKKNN